MLSCLHHPNAMRTMMTWCSYNVNTNDVMPHCFYVAQSEREQWCHHGDVVCIICGPCDIIMGTQSMCACALTEFRQPLEVQSHLEMPRILVQLGHIQRTKKLAPQIDPKWLPTWSLRRNQAICPLRPRDGRYVCQDSRTYRTQSRPKVISHGGTQISVSGPTHAG